MSERERLKEHGAEFDLTAEEFARSTPSVAAHHIDCDECGKEFVGDREKSTTCPTCRQELGMEMFP